MHPLYVPRRDIRLLSPYSAVGLALPNITGSGGFSNGFSTSELRRFELVAISGTTYLPDSEFALVSRNPQDLCGPSGPDLVNGRATRIHAALTVPRPSGHQLDPLI